MFYKKIALVVAVMATAIACGSASPSPTPIPAPILTHHQLDIMVDGITDNLYSDFVKIYELESVCVGDSDELYKEQVGIAESALHSASYIVNHNDSEYKLDGNVIRERKTKNDIVMMVKQLSDIVRNARITLEENCLQK